jgi:hypothetical protein
MSLTDEDKQWITDLVDAQTDRLVERMRDMQTELLRGFAAHADGMTIRVRKVEADHSNLDAAASGRIEIVERRLLEIEKRLGIP